MSIWQFYPADVPRFVSPTRGLLIEGQRTNAVRNPRAEGAVLGVLGSGGALPTNWLLGGTPTVTVVATGTENGLPYIDLDVAFAGAGVATIDFEASGIIAYTSGVPLTASYFARARAAIPAGFTVQVGLNWGAGAILRQSGNIALNTTALDRFTFTNPGEPTTLTVRPRIRFSASAAGTLQLRLAVPQLEIDAALASTPILPPVGAPAASTRGADIVTATLTAQGVPASGACTILGTTLLPQSAPAGISQTILQVDDGSDANRFTLANAAGGNSIVANRTLASVAGAGAVAGSMTPGTLFRVGISIDGAGRIACSLNGAAAVAQTGGPTSGLTRLLIGSSGAAGGLEALFGRIDLLRITSAQMGDAELAAAVGALV